MKIAIIGIRGTGKSTLARRLQERLGIHTLFADKYIWGENWVPRDKDEARRGIIGELENKKDWIFEGNFTYVPDYIFKNADTTIYLDYSGLVATIGCLKRWWKYRKHSDLESGEKRQKLELQYLIRKALLRENRVKIEDAITEYKPKNLKRFKNRKMLEKFLRQTDFNFSSNLV